MHDNVTEYSEEVLKTFNTHQLMNHLNDVRAYKSAFANYAGSRCCELCHEYIGPDWNTEIKPTLDEYDVYLKRIKDVLSTREHIPNKQEAKAIRQEKAKAKKNR